MTHVRVAVSGKLSLTVIDRRYGCGDEPRSRVKTIVLLSWKSFKRALKDVSRNYLLSPPTDHITVRQDR